MAIRRIQREIQNLHANPIANISVGYDSNDPMKCYGYIIGAVDTPFEGGIFRVEITFPDDYPFKPPSVKMLTKIYHPNISTGGDVCITITKKDYWNPALTIGKVLVSICSMLTDPDPTDTFHSAMGNEYMNNREQYNRTAREWTQRYAT